MQDPKPPSWQISAPARPSPEEDHLNCPRCHSDNTKFCYYNNYNLSQPRHFCKACRRYWTKGGTLRNIPVGGGSRKIAKRTSSASPSPASSAKRPTFSAPPSGEVTDKMPPKEDDGFGDFAGASVALSFSSLLGSGEDHFSNFLDGASGLQMDHLFGDRQDNDLGSGGSNGSNGDGFLGGGNGWPDLSMYTPGSSFL